MIFKNYFASLLVLEVPFLFRYFRLSQVFVIRFLANCYIGTSVEELESRLHPAVELSYLAPSPLDDYTLVFTHDKIHEAAYT